MRVGQRAPAFRSPRRPILAKSKRRMRRAVAMRQPLAHRGRLAAEMPCVVEAIDRPAAVVSFQFPESFQMCPRRPPNQTKTLAGPRLAVKSRRGGPHTFFASVDTGPGLKIRKQADVFVRCQKTITATVTPSITEVPIPDGVAEVMRRAPADAIDKREASIARGAEKTVRVTDGNSQLRSGD